MKKGSELATAKTLRKRFRNTVKIQHKNLKYLQIKLL
jgi:hypothetical protein